MKKITFSLKFILDFVAMLEIAKTHFPSNEDHEGAMAALFRLQDTYKVPSNKLAKGIRNVCLHSDENGWISLV